MRVEETRCPFCAIEQRVRAVVAAVTLGSTLCGCPARELGVAAHDGGSSGTTEASSVGATTAASSEPAPNDPDTTQTGTAEGDTSTDDEGDGGGCHGMFYGGCPPDGLADDCDLWLQDCPRGEKCMPWANDGGGSWNAARCSPLDPDPRHAGDACHVEGSGTSGIDDCEAGTICWDADPETNVGTCVDFCTGSATEPFCEDLDTSCAITNEGVLILCLMRCDPLMQDCSEGDPCLLMGADFNCAPGMPRPAALGDGCDYLNSCAPGLFCGSSEEIPGCEAPALGCCTEFCDLDVPDPSAGCSGATDGEICTPYFMTHDTFDHVGACLLPE